MNTVVLSGSEEQRRAHQVTRSGNQEWWRAVGLAHPAGRARAPRAPREPPPAARLHQCRSGASSCTSESIPVVRTLSLSAQRSRIETKSELRSGSDVHTACRSSERNARRFQRYTRNRRKQKPY